MDSIIEIKNLTKNYSIKKINKKEKGINSQKYHGIKSINLSVNKGEIFGFIGPNGAGKSTTINLLLNFIFADEGEAKIFNLDTVTESQQIKKKVGFVPSEVKYYNYNVLEILKYNASFYPNISMQDILIICNDLEIDSSKKIMDLSLGNKKKVALATSLLHRPNLLILDEPTNGLDPLIQKKWFNILLQQKKMGNTIFLSSHNLTEVENLCDRVAIIKEGEIIDILDLKKMNKKLGLKITIVSKDFKKILSLVDKKNILQQEGNQIIFIYSKNIDTFLKKIANYTIDKIFIEKQNLQNQFLGYYQ